jgi:hypothetical protein
MEVNMDFFGPNLINVMAILGLILIALVQIAGIVVTAILLRRKAGIGATLSLIGFSVLLLMGICGQIYNSFLFPTLVRQAGIRNITLVGGSYQCINGLILTIGFGLLVFGIWQLGQKVSPKETDTTESPEIEP